MRVQMGVPKVALDVSIEGRVIGVGSAEARGWKWDAARATGNRGRGGHLVVEDGDGGGVVEEVRVEQALRS